MSGWNALRDEFARSADAGAPPVFWWRDDDAVEPTPALDTLLAAASDAALPLALAVIPAQAGEPLAERLAGARGVTVLQHGYAHQNHAPPDDKKSELGGHRPADHVVAELALGLDIVTRRFGAQARAVLVPPWNRMLPKLVPMLPEFGLRGLSAFGPRSRPEPVARLAQINTHLDLVDWRGGRDFIGEAAALDALGAILAARRAGQADAREPLGVLTHHLVETASLGFVARLAETVRDAGLEWADPAALFGDD